MKTCFIGCCCWPCALAQQYHEIPVLAQMCVQQATAKAEQIQQNEDEKHRPFADILAKGIKYENLVLLSEQDMTDLGFSLEQKLEVRRLKVEQQKLDEATRHQQALSVAAAGASRAGSSTANNIRTVSSVINTANNLGLI